MIKIRKTCRVFLQGFAGLFLIFQSVFGILYWLCNVTRSQQFDTVSVMGKLMAALPILPVHLIQTGLVFAAAYYFFRRFLERRRSVLCALAAVTVPFVMQVCLSETEHAAALAAILCMTAVILDSFANRHTPDRRQMLCCSFCVGILLLCGAAYSCAGGLLYLMLALAGIFLNGKKKTGRALSVLAAVFIAVCFMLCGTIIQNKSNPDRTQITVESVLMKRFAYPCLDQSLADTLPQEIQDLYSASEIERLRLYPYLLDTTLSSDLTEAAGEERAREIYLELAWYGFQCGTKTDLFMMLEDALCYLTPQLMYPFYSNGTILAEFVFSFQQFISGHIYLSSLYLYGSLLGYAACLILTLLYGLGSSLTNHFRGLLAVLKRYWPILLLWLGLSVIFMMRGAAIFNYKYAAFQAILGYIPVLYILFSEPEVTDTGNVTAES